MCPSIQAEQPHTQPHESTASQQPLSRHIVIQQGTERYGIEISEIHEIIKVRKLTTIPNSVPYLCGVTNLRGKILPVISLRRRFSLEDAPPDTFTRIIVCSCNHEMVGIMVDRVHRVTQFTQLEPAGSLPGEEAHYFSGIGYTDEGMVSILNIQRVLNG